MLEYSIIALGFMVRMLDVPARPHLPASLHQS